MQLFKLMKIPKSIAELKIDAALVVNLVLHANVISVPLTVAYQTCFFSF